MAKYRQKLDTGAKETNAPQEPNKVEQALDAKSFNNTIRLLRVEAAERCLAVRQETFLVLKRLGVPRDTSKAATSTPDGSSQVDLGSLFTWMRKVDGTDADAVAQIVAIDATACSRT